MVNKEEILRQAKAKLGSIVEVVIRESEAVDQTISRLTRRLQNFASPDAQVEALILQNNREREKQLLQMKGSPYFLRLDTYETNSNESKEIYLGKFQMSDSNIYSWVSPIAQLRFGDMGVNTYRLPRGVDKTVEVSRKDQFMIVDGEIKYLASESSNYARTLIYQEGLVTHKKDFVLPEIVAQMEKAQDEVIRAHHLGSLLIAGPAGSGKTTLAFHRIAYLMQSPDTAKLFPGHTIIAFVQDESTEQYFSAILPQLGIEEVRVTTFEKWAFEILGLNDYQYANRYGESEKERVEFEYYKNKALKQVNTEISFTTNIEAILKKAYASHLPVSYQALLKNQLENKVLDRFDLTILLTLKRKADHALKVKRRVVIENKRGDLKIEYKDVPLSYSFMVVDEAENYLAEQIDLFKSCANENRALLYVGDLAQQTRLGTIKSWSEVSEDFEYGRKVVLDKVYRNTKEILEYVNKDGYEVNIPAGLKSGEVVVEINCDDKAAARLEALKIYQDSKHLVGLLYEPGQETIIQSLGFESTDNLKVLNFNEAQGVEFETVIILRQVRVESNSYPADLQQELEKVKRDLWYVALTRSMNRLYIVNYK